jgi:hypothetical protein
LDVVGLRRAKGSEVASPPMTHAQQIVAKAQ